MTRPVLPRRAPFLDERGFLTRESAQYLEKAPTSADWSSVEGKPGTFPPSAHTHPISDVTALQATLDGKAAVAHSHILSDVSGLGAALDGKAPLIHEHAIADVTGLQAALDAKRAEPDLFQYLASDRTGTNDANAQSWFDAASDAVTVEAAAYLMRGYLVLTSGTTSHSVGLLFGGTATVSLIRYTVLNHSGADNGTTTTQSTTRVARATNTTASAGNTTAGKYFAIDGLVVFSGAGTLIPQFQYSAGPGSSTVNAGTYFALTKLSGVSKGTWT